MAVAKATGLSKGKRVEIVSSGEEVVVRKLPADRTMEAMFSDKSPSDWRALYRAAHDWGEDQGRERVEE